VTFTFAATGPYEPKDLAPEEEETEEPVEEEEEETTDGETPTEEEPVDTGTIDGPVFDPSTLFEVPKRPPR